MVIPESFLKTVLLMICLTDLSYTEVLKLSYKPTTVKGGRSGSDRVFRIFGYFDIEV